MMSLGETSIPFVLCYSVILYCCCLFIFGSFLLFFWQGSRTCPPKFYVRTLCSSWMNLSSGLVLPGGSSVRWRVFGCLQRMQHSYHFCLRHCRRFMALVSCIAHSWIV